MKSVLIIAGEKNETVQIIEELAKMKINLAVASSSRLGINWLNRYEGLIPRQNCLTLEGISGFISDVKAEGLIDASLPLAMDTSLNAIRACKRTGIPYLRYEKAQDPSLEKDVLRVKDCREAVGILKDLEGNILFAVGMGKIEAFTSCEDIKKRLYICVFPKSGIIAKCEKLGLNAGNIIALSGPFTEDFYVQLLCYSKAAAFVVSDSGNPLRNMERVSAAKKLGIPFIMLDRDKPEFGSKATSLEEVAAFVKDK